MLSLEDIHSVSQLIETIEKLLEKVEESYSNKNASDFNKTKKEILSFQNKLAQIIKK